MCDCVLHYAFRFWLSLTITCHTRDMCYSRVTDADLPCARDLCIELQHKDGTSHSCHTCLVQVQLGVEREANAEVNFCPHRSHIVYIGHNPHTILLNTVTCSNSDLIS